MPDDQPASGERQKHARRPEHVERSRRRPQLPLRVDQDARQQLPDDDQGHHGRRAQTGERHVDRPEQRHPQASCGKHVPRRRIPLLNPFSPSAPEQKQREQQPGEVQDRAARGGADPLCRRPDKK